jgi:hypothetical protein
VDKKLHRIGLQKGRLEWRIKGRLTRNCMGLGNRKDVWYGGKWEGGQETACD